MKTRTITCALSFLAASIASLAVHATATHAAPLITPLPIMPRPDAALVRAVQGVHFSGAILVRERGRIVLRRAFGTSGRPITTETSFTTPQVTILFTQAALVRLTEQGKLPKAAVDTTQLGSGSGLQKAIGEIERASGLAFALYLQRSLFAPLHMTRTLVVRIAGAVPAVHTTVDDLDRWDQAALNCTAIVPPGMVWTDGKPWGWSGLLRGAVTIRSADVRNGLALSQHILPVAPGVDTSVTILSSRTAANSRLTATVLATLR